MSQGQAKMAATSNRVQNILISQPKPAQRTQYDDIERKFGVRIDFVPFVELQGLSAKEYRACKNYPDQFGAIVLTSRHAVDHFFRLCDDMRIKMSEETKYFCSTETIANYLQKFIIFRKRKVFNGVKSVTELKQYVIKNKEEKFLMPCSTGGNQEVVNFFKELKVPVIEAVMYRTVYRDLKDLSDIKYDIIAFFSPPEVNSLFDNFPNFKQEDRRIAVFGGGTNKAVTEHGMHVSIQAGTPESPSIAVALEKYLVESNKATA
jgi:uroporphyrinogen-III synthase